MKPKTNMQSRTRTKTGLFRLFQSVTKSLHTTSNECWWYQFLLHEYFDVITSEIFSQFHTRLWIYVNDYVMCDEITQSSISPDDSRFFSTVVLIMWPQTLHKFQTRVEIIIYFYNQQNQKVHRVKLLSMFPYLIRFSKAFFIVCKFSLINSFVGQTIDWQWVSTCRMYAWMKWDLWHFSKFEKSKSFKFFFSSWHQSSIDENYN